MTSSAPVQRSLMTESWIFAGRLFVQWRRYPMVPLQALLFPALLLVIYGLLVGKSMVRLTGNSGLDLLIPVCTLAGAMAGAIGAGLAVPMDRDSGLLTRLWIMPVHRTAPLTGALLAEAVRTFIGSAFVVAAGYLMGFRFSGGWLGLLLYLLIPVAVVVVFATVVISLALRPQARIILTWTQTVAMGLAFATLVPAGEDSGAAAPARGVSAHRARGGGHAGAVLGRRGMAADAADGAVGRRHRRGVRAGHRARVSLRGRGRQGRGLTRRPGPYSLGRAGTVGDLEVHGQLELRASSPRRDEPVLERQADHGVRGQFGGWPANSARMVAHASTAECRGAMPSSARSWAQRM